MGGRGAWKGQGVRKVRGGGEGWGGCGGRARKVERVKERERKGAGERRDPDPCLNQIYPFINVTITVIEAAILK